MSSDEDDLIVVRTEYNTVDPITKKEIGNMFIGTNDSTVEDVHRNESLNT